MNNHWQTIRIVLALCGIFAAGILTGRFTAPAPPVPAAGPAAAKGVTLETKSGPPLTTPQVVRLYQRMLGLTPGQRGVLTPMVRQTLLDAQSSVPGSPERFAAIQKLHARLRTILDAKQQTEFDRLAAQLEAQWHSRNGPAAETPDKRTP